MFCPITGNARGKTRPLLSAIRRNQPCPRSRSHKTTDEARTFRTCTEGFLNRLVGILAVVVAIALPTIAQVERNRTPRPSYNAGCRTGKTTIAMTGWTWRRLAKDWRRIYAVATVHRIGPSLRSLRMTGLPGLTAGLSAFAQNFESQWAGAVSHQRKRNRGKSEREFISLLTQ